MSKNFSRFLKTTASRAVLAASLAAMAAAGEAEAAAEATAGDKWSAYIDLEGELGEREKGEVNAFLPVLQDRASMMFLDLRGKLFSESEIEGNFGLGYRQRLNPDANIGIYGFFDVRNSEANNTFYQVTMGAEYLTRDWDLRGNLYIPLSDEKEIESSRRNLGARPLITGGNLIIRHGGTRVLIEEPLLGIDGEVGYRVPGIVEDDPDQELRVFAGAFYFDASDVDALVGPKARLEYRFYDILGLGPQSRITLGAEGRWDDERDAEGFVSARLRIPLQPVFTPDMAPKLSEMDRRMLDPIERDVDIVTQSRSETRGAFDEKARDLETGRVIQGARVLKGGGDASDLANRLGEDSLIVVDGRDGPVDLTDTIVVADGTKVVGGGTVVDIEGVKSGRQFAFQTPGTRGTLSGPAGMDTLQVGSDTILRSFDLVGGNRGLVFDGASNGLVQDVMISNTGGDAVSITGGSDNLSFMHVGVNNAGGRGIFADGASNLFFDDVHVDTTGSRGFDINNTTGLSVYHTTVANTGSGGFVTTNADDVMIENIAVSNTVGHGLRFSNSRNVTVDMASVGDTGLASIMIDSGSDDVTVMNAMVDGSGAQGVLLFNGTSNVTLDGLSVANTTGAGVVAQDTENFVLRNAQIRDTGVNGISLRRANGATLAGIAIDNAGGDGLAITNSNDVTVDMVNIESSANNGLAIGNGSDNVAVSNTVIGDSGRNGILLFGGVTNVTFDNVGVRDAAMNGIDIANSSAITVRNTTVTNTGSGGFVTTNADDVMIENIAVSNAGVHGLHFSNSRNVMASMAAISDVGGSGVLMDGGSDTLTLQVAAVDGTGSSGIRIVGGVANASVANVTTANTNGTGIAVGDSQSIEIRNAEVSDSLLRGISLGNVTDATLENFSIQNVAQEGVLILNSRNVMASLAAISDVGGSGVLMDGGSDTVTLELAAVDGTGSSGIRIVGGVANASVANVTTANTGGTGIAVGDSQSIEIRNAEVSDSLLRGISLGNVTDATLENFFIQNVAQEGVLILNSRNVMASLANIESSANNGLAIGNGSDNVAFSNTVIGDSGGNGIFLFGGVTNVTFDNVGVRDAAMNGIDIADSSAITVRNTTVASDAGAPVTMTGLRSVNTDGLTLENLTVSNVTGSGVDVRGDNATFDGVMVNNAGNIGIRFEGADSQLSNLSVDGAGSTGVLVVSSRNVDVDGVMVRNATTTGFAIDTFTLLRNGPSQDIRVSNVDVAGAGTFGVRVGRGTQNVVLDGLQIANSGTANVAVSLSSDIEISNAMLSGSMTGLSIDRGLRVTARNLTITDTVGDSIADTNSQELVLRDSTVLNAGGNGVFLDGTQNSFLRGLRIVNAEESGIHLMDTVNIGLQDTVITSNAGSPVTDTGLRAVNSNALQVRGLEVSNTTGNGVDIGGVNNDLIDVGVTNAGGSGIRYQGTDGLLSELTVNGAGSFGLLLRNVQNVSVTRSTFSNVSTGVSVDLPIFAGSRSSNILFSDITVENASSNGMALFNADNVVAEDILITGQSTNGLLIESTGGESFDGARITVDAVTTDSALNSFGPDANIQVTDVVLTGSGARAISLTNSMNIGGDADVDTSGYAAVCRAQPTLSGTITGSLSLGGLNGTTPPATCP